MTDTKISVDELSIDDLLDLKDAIEARLDALAKTEVDVIEKRLTRLKTYMNGDAAKPAETAAPVEAAPKVRKKPGPKPGRKKKAAKAAAAGAHKLPAKYRDPATGKTWSGRGPAPSWLREHAAKKGNSREDLAV